MKFTRIICRTLCETFLPENWMCSFSWPAHPCRFFCYGIFISVVFHAFIILSSFCCFTCLHTHHSVSRVVTKVFYTSIISTSSLWRAFLFLVTLSLLLSVFILQIKLCNFIRVERVLHCEGFSSNVFITDCVLIFSRIFKPRQVNNRNDAGVRHKTGGVRTRAPRRLIPPCPCFKFRSLCFCVLQALDSILAETRHGRHIVIITSTTRRKLATK